MKRRDVLKSVGASIGGVAAVGNASAAASNDPAPSPVDAEVAREKLAANEWLLAELAANDLIGEPSPEAFALNAHLAGRGEDGVGLASATVDGRETEVLVASRSVDGGRLTVVVKGDDRGFAVMQGPDGTRTYRATSGWFCGRCFELVCPGPVAYPATGCWCALSCDAGCFCPEPQ